MITRLVCFHWNFAKYTNFRAAGKPLHCSAKTFYWKAWVFFEVAVFHKTSLFLKCQFSQLYGEWRRRQRKQQWRTDQPTLGNKKMHLLLKKLVVCLSVCLSILRCHFILLFTDVIVNKCYTLLQKFVLWCPFQPNVYQSTRLVLWLFALWSL